MPIWTNDRGFKKVVRVQYGEARDIATVILTIVILYFACRVCTTDIGGKTALGDHVWFPWEVWSPLYLGLSRGWDCVALSRSLWGYVWPRVTVSLRCRWTTAWHDITCQWPGGREETPRHEGAHHRRVIDYEWHGVSPLHVHGVSCFVLYGRTLVSRWCDTFFSIPTIVCHKIGDDQFLRFPFKSVLIGNHVLPNTV
jgi:hypothetical protein